MNVLFLIAGYFIGAIPNAFWVGQLFKRTDVRKVGTRNVGAMNTFLNIGFLPGLLTLFSDLFKSAGIVFLSTRFGDRDAFAALPVAVATMVVLGHNFNVFLGFRGGKGLSCVVGTLLVLFPLGVLLLYALVGLLILIIRNPDVSSGLGMLSFPFMMHHAIPGAVTIVFSVIITLLVLFKHKRSFMKLFDERRQASQ